MFGYRRAAVGIFSWTLVIFWGDFRIQKSQQETLSNQIKLLSTNISKGSKSWIDSSFFLFDRLLITQDIFLCHSITSVQWKGYSFKDRTRLKSLLARVMYVLKGAVSWLCYYFRESNHYISFWKISIGQAFSITLLLS